MAGPWNFGLDSPGSGGHPRSGHLRAGRRGGEGHGRARRPPVLPLRRRGIPALGHLLRGARRQGAAVRLRLRLQLRGRRRVRRLCHRLEPALGVRHW